MTQPTVTDCAYCGVALNPERAELGYTYCTDPFCVAQGFKPKTAIGVAVPKSTFFVEGFLEDDPRAGLTTGRNPRRP